MSATFLTEMVLLFSVCFSVLSDSVLVLQCVSCVLDRNGVAAFCVFQRFVGLRVDLTEVSPTVGQKSCCCFLCFSVLSDSVD